MTAEYLSKPIMQMTGAEFLTLIGLSFMELSGLGKEKEVAQSEKESKTYYRGHIGIRTILEELNLTCSHAKAQKIKDSGICNEAISQDMKGRTYKIDVELFKQLFLERRKQFNF